MSKPAINNIIKEIGYWFLASIAFRLLVLLAIYIICLLRADSHWVIEGTTPWHPLAIIAQSLAFAAITTPLNRLLRLIFKRHKAASI